MNNTLQKTYCTIALIWILASVQAVWGRTNLGGEAALKEQGKTLCYSGRYEEAIPYLEKAVKQNRRSGALYYLAICRQHVYDFEGALDAVETYKAAVTSPEWKDHCDSVAAECRMGQRAFDHIQDVVIIDSMTVEKETFFQKYKLGSESGRIGEGENGLYYENQAADYRIESTGEGLVEHHKFQDKWEDPQPLKGIGTERFQLIDPFLRSDGETLYFACDSTPGMGGLDIYRTTYNSDDNQYYQPERLGMPFNSPFNDYMMAIDETNQVGWWATDRNAPEGYVTIYLFLMDEEAQYLEDSEVGRARIDDIRATWRDEKGYAELLDQIQNAPQKVEVKQVLHIVINDDKVYTSEEDFRNPDALAAYRKSIALEKQIAEAEAELLPKRTEFRTADQRRKKVLRLVILRAENNLANLYKQQHEAVLKYRRLEQ